VNDDPLYDHPGWDACTFEGARRAVLREGIRTTFREKLEWLEEAETLSLLFRDARKVGTSEAGERAKPDTSASSGPDPRA
jgi:hypothetical protein